MADNDGYPSLERLQEVFSHDRFASGMGCRIVEASPGHAVCEFDVSEAHRNGRGAVMGGAVFTLADFAIAVASNADLDPGASVSSTVEFMSGVRGTRLTAVADADKRGRTLGFYRCLVTDDLGTQVARVIGTIFYCRR